MKNQVLIYLILFLSPLCIHAQDEVISPHSMIQIEELPLQPGISKAREFPLKRFGRSGENPFIISFVGDHWTPDFKNAVHEATQIWADAIQINGPIEIRARLDNSISGLAVAYSAVQIIELDNGEERVVSGALANHLAGKDVNVGPEMSIYFRQDLDWYTEINTATLAGSGQLDLISAALHEICHGLGFFGSASVSGNLGYFSENQIYAYDSFVKDASGNSITSYTSASSELAAALTGNLMLSSPSVEEQLYSPNTWKPGSSYSHFHTHGFMDPGLQAEAVKRDVSRSLPFLQDLGYGSLNSLLPVQLLAFDIKAIHQNTVNIEWLVAQEYDIEYYAVERSTDNTTWERIKRVESIESGISQHTYRVSDILLPNKIVYYRLTIHELDGSVQYSDIQSVSVQSSDWNIYPTVVKDSYLTIEAPEPMTLYLRSANGHLIKEFIGITGSQMISVRELTPGWYAMQTNSGQTKPILITP